MDKKTFEILYDLKKSVEEIKASMLTKEDAKNFLTKQDAKKFLTKEDAKNFVTKDDLKKMLRLQEDEIITEVGELVREFADRLEEKKADKPQTTLLKQ